MLNDWRIMMALRLFGTVSGNRLMSFVGFLSVAGLTLAVAVLVVVLSVVNGFEKELKERVLGVLPHGTLYTRSVRFDWQTERQRVLQHSEIVGAAPVVEGAGLVVSGGELVGIQFRGIDTSLEHTVSILPRYLVDGVLSSLAEPGFRTIVGSELADALDIGTGDSVTLVLPEVRPTLAGPVMTTRRLQVAGVFNVGADLDKNVMLLNLDDAKKLKRRTAVDGLVIRTIDLFQAPRILHELMLSSDNDNLFGVSWMRQHGNLYDAIQTQKATMFFLLLILVAVAAFNIVSNLVMTVDDSRSEIAILKTMGASPADLRLVFVCHGLTVCVTGLVLGMIAGSLITLSLGPLYSSLSDWLGLNLMSEYFIRYLPIEIRASDLVAIGLSSLMVCSIATIFPASRAARANPVEVLAHEV